jgi:hypothetical protein
MNTTEFTNKQSASMKALFFFFFFIVLTFFSSFSVKAQGNLLITPRRVVFEGNKKSQDINLANTGKDTAKYVISIVQIRMKEDGAFETITTPDPGQRFADPYLRFFPRTVVLGPNEAQVVKIQLIKSGQLIAGEYRSHIYFRAVPNLKPLGEAEPVKDSSTISVHLTPIFGITIPVIIRAGESDTKVSLSDISLSMMNDTLPMLKLMFNRTGNMSVFGDLAVEYISQQGKKTQVGKVTGIAVYTPNLTRRFQFQLDKVKGVDYHSGSLRLAFSSQSDTKQELLSEADITLK